MTAIPSVRAYRFAWWSSGMSRRWRRYADQDAAQLIGLIGIDGYCEWVKNESGITDQSTWRDFSLAISDKIFEVLQERHYSKTKTQAKEIQP